MLWQKEHLHALIPKKKLKNYETINNANVAMVQLSAIRMMLNGFFMASENLVSFTFSIAPVLKLKLLVLL